MNDMSGWMTEEYGIPHKNGKVRWYVIGADDDMYAYLGSYDMTDWGKGLEKVMVEAEKIADGSFNFHVLRHDQLMTLARNVQYAMEEALEVKGETTYDYWIKRWVELRGDSQE
jgi:hypothetical protein